MPIRGVDIWGLLSLVPTEGSFSLCGRQCHFSALTWLCPQRQGRIRTAASLAGAFQASSFQENVIFRVLPCARHSVCTGMQMNPRFLLQHTHDPACEADSIFHSFGKSMLSANYIQAAVLRAGVPAVNVTESWSSGAYTSERKPGRETGKQVNRSHDTGGERC